MSQAQSTDIAEDVSTPTPVVRDEEWEESSFTFLTVNDLYEISAVDGWGGFAELHAVVNEERERCADKDKPCFFTVNGDFMSASAASIKYKGKHCVSLFNAMEVDAVVFGNHEFDFGNSILRDVIAASKFKWFGTNVLQSDSDEVFGNALREDIWEAGPLRIGVFGLCTRAVPQLSFPGPDVTFAPVLECAEMAVKRLKAKGCHYIVCLTHLTYQEDMALARAVRGIDLILGGHDHEVFSCTVGNTLILKCGCDAKYLGRVDVTVRWRTGHPNSQSDIHNDSSNHHNTESGLRVVIPRLQLLPIINIPNPVPETAALVAGFSDVSAEQQALLCRFSYPIDTSSSLVRSHECSFGSFVADAMRATLQADIAIINGGFLRGNRAYPSDNNGCTDFTLADLARELPFASPVVLVQMRMREVKQALDSMLRFLPQLSGAFPHLSGAISKYDPNAAPLSRVISLELTARTQAENNPLVTVAMTEFMHRGGDGCVALSAGESIPTPEWEDLPGRIGVDLHGKMHWTVRDCVAAFCATFPGGTLLELPVDNGRRVVNIAEENLNEAINA
jgi:2',3'-cyclic-nucleotide 2'-phosphodiesterase (5'-nucleotidase family)